MTDRLAAAQRRLNDSFLDIAGRMRFEPTMAREFGSERQASIRLLIERLPGGRQARLTTPKLRTR